MTRRRGRYQMQSWSKDGRGRRCWTPMEDGAAATVWRPRDTAEEAASKCLAWTGGIGIPAMQVVDLHTGAVVWRYGHPEHCPVGPRLGANLALTLDAATRVTYDGAVRRGQPAPPRPPRQEERMSDSTEQQDLAAAVGAMLHAPSTEAARRIGDDFVARVEADEHANRVAQLAQQRRIEPWVAAAIVDAGLPDRAGAGGAFNSAENKAIDKAKARRSQAHDVRDERARKGEPDAVYRARGVLADVDPDRVKRVGYTAKEAAALRTIQRHNAQQAAKAQGAPSITPRTRKEKTTMPSKPASRELYSTVTFDADRLKGIGSCFAVFAHPGPDGTGESVHGSGMNEGDHLVFLGVFPGKSRQDDVAGPARAQLVQYLRDSGHGDAETLADSYQLVSAKPNHFRTTPPIPAGQEQAATAAQEPAQADAPAAEAPAPDEWTEDGAPITDADVVSSPEQDAVRQAFAAVDTLGRRRDALKQFSAADLAGYCEANGLTPVERTDGKAGEPRKTDLVERIVKYAAALDSQDQQQPAAA